MPGPFYNNLNWGGFLIWYMPDYPVAIDGRNDLNGDELDRIFFNSQNADTSYATDPYLNEAGEVPAEPEKIGEQMRTSGADYIVTNWWDPWDENLYKQGLLVPMAELGDSLDHASDGYLLTQAGYSHRQIYFIFKRTVP